MSAEEFRSRTSRPRLMERLVDVATILAGTSAVVLTTLVLWRANTSLESGSTNPGSVIIPDWESFSDGGHRIGSPDAPITIVEFGAYQCRYCREAEPHLSAIRRKYGHRVAFVFRHFPLVSESISYAAARAAECAGEQGAFWPFHELLFASRDWQNDDPLDAFDRMSMDLGIPDDAAFRKCIRVSSPVPAIAADLAAAERLGVSGTPAFLVNDRLSMGVLDSLAFDVAHGELLRQ